MPQQYKGLPVNSGNNNQHSMNEVILEHIYKRFSYITSKLSQVFIIRFDLHLTDSNLSPIQENSMVSAFFNNLIQKELKRGKAPHKHVVYSWVREVEKSKKAHYHCWIAFDKHKLDKVGSLKTKSGIYGLMHALWDKASRGGCLSIANGALDGLKVTNQLEKEKAFYALSYLAKSRGKGVRHDTKVRDYGGSRV